MIGRKLSYVLYVLLCLVIWKFPKEYPELRSQTRRYMVFLSQVGGFKIMHYILLIWFVIFKAIIDS